MPTVYVRLDPRKLQNPDLDIRYVLPDLVADRSSGVVSDDGYDYIGPVPYLLICLNAFDVDEGLRWVLDTLEHEVILENDLLQAAVVAVDRNGKLAVEYPKNFDGSFPV